MNPATVRGPTGDALPAYVSNGVVGLRVRDVPLRAGLATLSGLEGEHPDARVAAVPPIPYPLVGDLRIGDFVLSHHGGAVEDVSQDYDFATGELTTRFCVPAPDATISFEVLTYCSRTHPTVAVQHVTLTADRDTHVTLSVGIDPGGVPGTFLDRATQVPDADDDSIDGLMWWETLGGLATCGLAYFSECSNPLAQQTRSEAAHSPLNTAYTTDVRRGEAFTVRQATAVVPSTNHAQPHREAVRLAAAAQRAGFTRLRDDNRAAWAELWKARVVLLGADARWQSLADAAFFYIHTSTHPGSLSSHPFGLAQWHGYHYYYGHFMWDVDTFVMPPLFLTNPAAAGALLDFRARCLEAARENARFMGYRGAQFPWEASPARGEEAAPALGTAALYEHHVTADVARAFAQFAFATGDPVYTRDRAWPVISSAAAWIASRGTQTARGWEIREAMGIAERKEPADNAAFVNMISQRALVDATWCAEQVGVDLPPAWCSMRDNLVLPRDGNVILDHDGYTPDEEKGSTPAALAGIFPGGYDAAPEVRDATLRFYLDMADDYAGAPMLSSLLGVWATMLGDRAESTRLFEEGYAKFGSDRFNIVHEYRRDRFPEQPVSGPFLANMGGFLLGLLYGLTGIELGPGDPQSWCARPVVMPDAWDGVEVERLWVRDRPASLSAKHGADRATLEFLD